MEVLKEDEKGDEVELCLELSIGGRYGKIGDDSKGGLWDPNNEGKNRDDPRLDFSCGFELEAQKFRSRLEDRENRERDGFGDELVRKRDKNVGKGVAAERQGLSLSLLDGTEGGLYPVVQHVNAGNEDNVLLRKNLNSSELEFGSLERSCSAVSDYQSTTQKGGSGSDTGSHSSHSHSQQLNSPSPHTKPNHHPVELRHSSHSHSRQLNSPSPHTKPNHHLVELPKHDAKAATLSLPKPSQHNDDETERSNNACPMSSSDKPPMKETSKSPVEKPPKPPNNLPNIPSTHRMPCVTTTGDGPNGKTIAGFLYKYTNAEVVIMCVCHGGFFTPAEFVEHAGGINVSHPLRHITVVPSPYG